MLFAEIFTQHAKYYYVKVKAIVWVQSKAF